jgi:hypothetical protein
LKAVFSEYPTFHGVSEGTVEVLWAKSQGVGRQAQIRKDLDDTKRTLHKTIEAVLERRETLDNMGEKCDTLSVDARMFYNQVHLSLAYQVYLVLIRLNDRMASLVVRLCSLCNTIHNKMTRHSHTS